MSTACKDSAESVGSERNLELRQQVRDNAEILHKCWLTGEYNREGWVLSRTKRVVDFFASLLVLMALIPIIGVIALAIKCTSHGPVIFTQERTGYLGRRFKMYKFRTMVHNAEEKKTELTDISLYSPDSPDFKAKEDPRVTRLGAVLRKYSLDELPQIYNVLKGDMSLVGPRPTSFRVEEYQPYHMARLASPPGLTCIWQISGRSNIDFDGRVRLDKVYIENQSPLLDIIILLKTPLAVLKADGAY